VPTAYSRVTLVNGTRRIDLAVPGTVPLADVMPQLVRWCAPAERPDEPVPWTLGRLGGPNLSLSTTLQDAAVVDGEVLELRAPRAVVHPAYVEDVRDAVEDAVDESGRRWEPATTVGFALGAGATGLVLAALMPEARQPRDAVALGFATVAAALGVVAAWWSDRRGHRYAAQVAVAVAGLWGGMAGWLGSTFRAWPWPASLVAALAAGLAVVALTRAVTALATAHLTAAATLCTAGLPLGGLALGGYDWLPAVRVDAALAVLVVGVLPRVSLTVGGLASDDYQVRRGGEVTGEELASRIRQSTALLYGALGAAAVVGMVAGVVLSGGSTWDRLLGLSVGLALALRSRIFSRIPQIVPLRVAGLVVLVAEGLRAARENIHAGPWLVAWAAAVAAGTVTLSAVPLSDVARARVKQLLNNAEMAVVVAMVVLLAGALGGYDWVGRAAA
jgi:type VII secretion integral membrane protein EccD